MLRLFSRFAVLFMILVSYNPIAYADSWLPPKPSATYESAAQDARFNVTAGDRPGLLLGASGTMSVKKPGSSDASWIKVWEHPLHNYPVTALVAQSGWRVVTFDSWYSAGYGDEVMVFYDEKGSVLKKYSLESLLSETEINKVPRSLSSRWWRAKTSIDETLGRLKVEVAQYQDNQRSTKSLSFDLKSGEVITP